MYGKNKFLKAIVECVHRDDKIPYFTIRTVENYLQTTSERLFVHADKELLQYIIDFTSYCILIGI